MLIGLKQNKTHLSKIPLVNETNFFHWELTVKV